MDRERLQGFLNSLGPLSFIGFILLQALQVVAAPVPGEVTGLIGGFLYGPFLGIILSTIGLTLGSWLAFFLSKTFGRPFVDKFVSKQTLDKYDYLLHHKGAFLVFVLFLIPGFPKDILCYILGLGHLSTKEFLAISTVGRFAGTVLLTVGGSYLRHQQYREIFQYCSVLRSLWYSLSWSIRTRWKGYSGSGISVQGKKQEGTNNWFFLILCG